MWPDICLRDELFQALPLSSPNLSQKCRPTIVLSMPSCGYIQTIVIQVRFSFLFAKTAAASHPRCLFSVVTLLPVSITIDFKISPQKPSVVSQLHIRLNTSQAAAQAWPSGRTWFVTEGDRPQKIKKQDLQNYFLFNALSVVLSLFYLFVFSQYGLLWLFHLFHPFSIPFTLHNLHYPLFVSPRLSLCLSQLPVSLILNPVEIGQAEWASFDQTLISGVLTVSAHPDPTEPWSPVGELQTGVQPPTLLDRKGNWRQRQSSCLNRQPQTLTSDSRLLDSANHDLTPFIWDNTFASGKAFSAWSELAVGMRLSSYLWFSKVHSTDMWKPVLVLSAVSVTASMESVSLVFKCCNPYLGDITSLTTGDPVAQMHNAGQLAFIKGQPWTEHLKQIQKLNCAEAISAMCPHFCPSIQPWGYVLKDHCNRVTQTNLLLSLQIRPRKKETLE